MTAFAEAMQARGVTAVTFDFPYMRAGRRTPDRAPVLEATWRTVIEDLTTGDPSPPAVVIGGKSMGGRIASHVLSDPSRPLPDVVGLVLLGYPLHPPGQPTRLRTAHLPQLATPTLVVQGSDDTFGTEQEVRGAFAVVAAAVDWLIVPGGDHSLEGAAPRRAVPDRRAAACLRHGRGMGAPAPLAQCCRRGRGRTVLRTLVAVRMSWSDVRGQRPVRAPGGRPCHDSVARPSSSADSVRGRG